MSSLYNRRQREKRSWHITMLSVVTIIIAVIGSGLPTTNSRHRIVGGTDTTIEEHPYQVAIENESETLVCGGSILAPKIIISAAHPFHDDYNQLVKQNYLTRVGSTLLQAGGELYKFPWRQIQVHPRYGEEHIFDYDVAIIIVEKEIKFSLKAEPIPLIESGKEIADGTKLIVTGYGSSSVIDEKYPEKLQVATIEKQNRDVCTSLQGVNITDRMICVGSGIPTPYYGDSGGPLINMERKLVGIVSWGKTVPKNKDPAVFTNIAHPAIQTFILQEKSSI